MCVLLVFSQLFDTGEVVVRRLIEANDHVVPPPMLPSTLASHVPSLTPLPSYSSTYSYHHFY